MLSIPAARPRRPHLAIADASCVRCIHASTPSSNDCAPSDSRLTPASRHARAASAVTSSGIGFERDLFGARSDTMVANEVEQRARLRRRRDATVCRRRSTGCRPASGAASAIAERQLALDTRVEVFVNRHDAAHRDGEVAVRAASRAERDVNVDVAGRQRNDDGCTSTISERATRRFIRRRISPVSAHSTAPRSSSPVTAARHSATGSAARAHSSSSVRRAGRERAPDRASRLRSPMRGAALGCGDKPASVNASAIGRRSDERRRAAVVAIPRTLRRIDRARHRGDVAARARARSLAVMSAPLSFGASTTMVRPRTARR